MLGVSLRHRGLELLRRLEDLEAAGARGSTAGIPFLYPWANRLASPSYRAAGRDVTLDPSSPLLHGDEHGLPIHGVKWASLAWDVTAATSDRLVASLDWTRPELLAVFPFRHTIEMIVTLRPDGLTMETEVIADDPVPVSFGFHPYFGIPRLPRAKWRLELPATRRLVLDERGIPTGAEEPCDRLEAELGERSFDDGFALPEGGTSSFSLGGAGLTITVEFLAGYRYAQIFAPRGRDFVAIEPMTAPTSALTSGRGLSIVAPHERFRASFRVRVIA